MMNENILDIEASDEIRMEKDSAPDMVFARNEELTTITALKTKFLKLQDKLSKMREDIHDVEERLYGEIIY